MLKRAPGKTQKRSLKTFLCTQSVAHTETCLIARAGLLKAIGQVLLEWNGKVPYKAKASMSTCLIR